MTIPEAGTSWWSGGTYGEGGEIFVLDMGEPVKILDLAKSPTPLSGHKLDEHIPHPFSQHFAPEKNFMKKC